MDGHSCMTSNDLQCGNCVQNRKTGGGQWSAGGMGYCAVGDCG